MADIICGRGKRVDGRVGVISSSFYKARSKMVLWLKDQE